MDEGKGLGAHPDLLGRCPEAATARAVKPDRFLPELWWKSYSFCHVDSLLEHPLCPISGCQRKRVNSTISIKTPMPTSKTLRFIESFFQNSLALGYYQVDDVVTGGVGDSTDSDSGVTSAGGVTGGVSCSTWAFFAPQ